MIRYLNGSIFDSPAQCLVNPVNCVGVMGKGLALDFKRRYPKMFESYVNICKAGELKPGKLVFYTESALSHTICLFPTKIDWRHPSKVEYIESGLLAFVKYYNEWDIKSVAMPHLGCGLGGLSFALHFQPLAEKILGELPIEVLIYGTTKILDSQGHRDSLGEQERNDRGIETNG